MSVTPIEIAEKLYAAAESATPILSFSNQGTTLSLSDAYAIQNMLLEKALAKGDGICGYKMGLTSKAKQRDVQVFEPIRGFLKKSTEIVKNGRLETTKLIHPRVEPEISVVFKDRLKGPGLTLRDVHRAIGAVYPALEIVDSRYEKFQFSLADVIADNTSAAHFMVGTVNLIGQVAEVPLLGISVRKNGDIIETGAPAAVLGDPFLPLVSLANALGEEGKEIVPGMVVLTGGITNSVPFQKGDVIEIVWPMETLAFTAS